MKLLSCVAAIFLPPLGVLLGGGKALDFVLNVILCCFFWVPGIIHALWVILREADGTIDIP